MELPEFRRRFTDAQLAAIYAYPEAGGMLKQVLGEVRHQENAILTADTAVRVCRARFEADVDPLFFDRDFLYAFLSTWDKEDSFRSHFSTPLSVMSYCTDPALCYAIHDHGKWLDQASEAWVRCANKIGWDGVMPVEVLHRKDEGFCSRMVAYWDSPIWDCLGFTGRQVPGIPSEPFPFESDCRVSSVLSMVSEDEIRRMYIRVGLKDPKEEILERMRRYKRSHGAEPRVAIPEEQAHVLSSWLADREAEHDRAVYEPDPPSFDAPPPAKVPDRSYARDDAKHGIDEAIRIINKHHDSICEKTLSPILKSYAQVSYMSVAGLCDAAVAEASLLAVREAIGGVVGLCSKLRDLQSKVVEQLKWWESSPLPTEIDGWADYEQAMYSCSFEVSELHGQASDLYKSRKEFSDKVDAAIAPIGKLKAVRKTSVPALLEKASELCGNGELRSAQSCLIEAAATGERAAYEALANVYVADAGNEISMQLSEAYRLSASIVKGQ